jgi:hypothetical protein
MPSCGFGSARWRRDQAAQTASMMRRSAGDADAADAALDLTRRDIRQRRGCISIEGTAHPLGAHRSGLKHGGSADE